MIKLLLPYFIAFVLASGLFLGLIGCQPAAMPLPTQMPTAVTVLTFTPQATPTQTNTPTVTPMAVPSSTPVIQRPSATPLPTDTPPATATTPANALTQTVGLSSQGRPIVDYQFKNGPDQVVFVGGIHGGYEWNTILLAYEAIAYFQANIDQIPDSITLHIIPSANPDGQFLVTGSEGWFAPTDVISDTVPGRFNGSDVDLNRNWDCNWQASGLWRDQWVSGGERPFSEPETAALSSYLVGLEPKAVIFWHSALNGVFAAGCPETHQPSYALATVYGLAGGYPIYEAFTSYPVTGDASDWLTTQGITSMAVELTNHSATDWPQNLKGILAVLDYYE
ncbi:MAG: hypothetical protein KA362_19090 [Chloroflexi bacterium]|nr:hypothetical protein [Chloroflexota bacterium]